MPFSYKFHCKKCGHYAELPTKQEWLLEKQAHKRRGCQLMTAPHKDVGVLARPELALEAIEGKEMVMEAGVISLEDLDEENDSASGSDETVPGSTIIIDPS